MKTYNEGGLDILSWCENPEQGAIDQALNASKLPFAFKHIALMPDAHQGYGVCVGSVLATKDVIIPNAIGVDISCGMACVKTPWKDVEISTDVLKKIMGKIRKVVPVGFNHHKENSLEFEENLNHVSIMNETMFATKKEIASQLATLGGG